MRTPDTLDLGHGEYVITASEMLGTLEGSLTDLVTGDWDTQALEDAADPEEAEGLHAFTIERVGGGPALEIVRTQETGEIDLGISIPTAKDVHLFRPPEGEPALAVEAETGLRGGYTIRDPGGNTLATLEKSGLVFGGWDLADAAGDVQATVERERSLGDLVSSTTSYGMATPEGREVASLEYREGSGGLTGIELPEMEVSCERSPVPTALSLAAAFGIFLEAKKDSSSSGGGGDAE